MHTDSCFIRAVKENDLAQAKNLVESCGVSVNTRDYGRDSAISLACIFSSIGMVEYLLSVGVDVNVGYPTFEFEIFSCVGAPLSAAARRGSLSMFKLLLNAGAEVNFKYNQWASPLSFVLTCSSSFNEFQYTQMLKLLLASGVNTDIKIFHGSLTLEAYICHFQFLDANMVSSFCDNGFKLTKERYTFLLGVLGGSIPCKNLEQIERFKRALWECFKRQQRTPAWSRRKGLFLIRERRKAVSGVAVVFGRSTEHTLAAERVGVPKKDFCALM